MTREDYDKKIAVLREAEYKAYKVWREDYKVWDKACKAINDLEASWKKQESEEVK